MQQKPNKIFALFLLLFCFTAFSVPIFAANNLEINTFTLQPAQQVIDIYGFTRASATMPLISEEAGKVVRITTGIGKSIPESGIFACLDDTFTKLDQQINQVEQKRLRIDVRYFQKETQRRQRLIKKNSTSQADLDSTQRQLHTTQQQLKTLKIEQKRLQERLLRVCIHAPVGWQLIEQNVEPGQWVSTGQNVATVGNFQILNIPLVFTPQEFVSLQQQAKITIEFPDYNNQKANASIDEIFPNFDVKTRKVNINLKVEKNLPVHRGGLRVRLRLNLVDASGAWIAPDKAIQTRYNTHYLQRQNGTKVKIQILGKGTEKGTSRVWATDIHAGEIFLLENQENKTQQNKTEE